MNKCTYQYTFKGWLPVIMILGILFFTTCKPKENLSGVPAYVRIQNVSVVVKPGQGDAFQNISECWVDESGQLLGAYEYPVSVPVLDGGKQSISISAGVHENGGAATRNYYPFYA